jgi:hypothetical protein
MTNFIKSISRNIMPENQQKKIFANEKAMILIADSINKFLFNYSNFT